MDDDAAKKESSDVVVLGPPTSDGEGVRVLRAREQRIETGELRALKDGKPISGEIVALEPRQDNPRVCDVKASYSATDRGGDAKKGPAQVATQTYRDNWDEVFGAGKRNRERALN